MDILFLMNFVLYFLPDTIVFFRKDAKKNLSPRLNTILWRHTP